MHDEAAALDAFFARLLPVLQASGESFEIVCINDGSRDATLQQLRALQPTLPGLRVIDLARNFGKEAALTCGLDHALGAAVIPIDADLQDPPELIPEMLRLWRSGFEVVLPQRVDRSSDGLLKRKTADWFYRLNNRISDAPLPVNVGDFRLMDRKVVDAVKRLPESHRFMKGLFAWVGFRQATIPYTRAPRSAGRTKFSGWRLWNLAIEGITSFSTAPLRIWTYLGSLVALVAFAYALFIIGRTLVLGSDLPGYASLITVVLFLGGVQLIGLGVIGEYLGRLYGEAKGRPVYIVREQFDSSDHAA
ncbi:MAG TPA: glycosyltransferase family 2 protein [Aquabacterium sp.]|nr:glycosyltransferase family 2 protein [Aquabacterium sp.]HSW04684.1 glycosyltransferase family 2 protein [Aquabacterium sp.]